MTKLQMIALRGVLDCIRKGQEKHRDARMEMASKEEGSSLKSAILTNEADDKLGEGAKLIEAILADEDN